MKFGKLADISKVNFQLPQDPSGTKTLLQSLAHNDEIPTTYIGCTGWSMKEWIGKVYPKGSQAKDFLKYYTAQFNTIELNTTHYRIPSDDTIAVWKRESSPDFRFCPKVPQIISHSKDLGYASGNVLAFCNSIQQLKEKLGCCFLQLPPYFGNNKIGLLEHFIKNFPKHIPLAIELRHESWFNDVKSFEEVFSLFEIYNISTVITDVAGRRDVLHQRLTTNTVLIRFVGNNLHATDYERVDSWVARIKTWFEDGLTKVYFFTHEPDNLLAPELAFYLYEQIKTTCKVETRGPDLNLYKGGDQISLF